MLRPLSADVKKSLEAATALYVKNLNTAHPFLAARDIHPATSERFRLGLVGTGPTDIHPGHEDYAGRLAIPAIGPNGVQSIRFRCLADHNCHDVGCPKYLGDPSTPTRPFNLRAVTEADDIIIITEGELDAVTLEQCGLHAVGIPGANNWKPHYARIFNGFPKVIVIGDNDDAGKAFANKVAKTMWNARSRIVGALAEDVTDFYTREGKAALVAAVLGDEV